MMNINLDNLNEEQFANYLGNKGQGDLDKELEDLINDDPELKEIMSPDINKKKKKKVNEDDLQLEDLDSEKNDSDKELDDLLNEENPDFKRSMSKQESMLKSSTFGKNQTKVFDSKVSINSNKNGGGASNLGGITQNNLNLRSTLYLDEVKEEPEKDHKSKSEMNKAQPTKIQINNKDPEQERMLQTGDESNKEYYDEKVEKFYHSVENMKSLGVLTKEIELMDYIISFCKKNELDYDAFDNKKFFIKNKMDTINAMIEYEEMDFEGYKASIKQQLEFDQALIKRVEEDKFIKNKEFVKNRIQKRIEIINDELTQQPVDEEPDEGVQEENVVETVEKVEPSKSITEMRKSTSNVNKDSLKKSELKEVKVEQIKVEEVKPVKVNKIKNQKLYDETKAKAEDYRQAVEYFIQIESMSQAEDARSKAQILNQALEDMSAGKEIDELDLPIAITPDYICGMTKQERLNKFSVIIKDFSAKKNEESQKIQKAIEGFKTLDKKIFLKE